MYSLRVCTTNDRQLPPPEFGAELTWDRLTEALRREVGPEAAALLAEPVRDPARGQTHWHITAEGDPVPISALAPAERSRLAARLDTIRRNITDRARQLEGAGGEANARLAAALQTIVDVPDEEAHVWSVAGQPMLTAWGRRSGAVARPAATIILRSPAPQNADPTAAAPTTMPVLRSTLGQDDGVDSALLRSAPTGEITAGVPARRGRPQWPTPLLWVLFLLVLGSIYYALLAACALDVPVLRSILNRCQTTAARDLDGLRERNDALKGAIREAERRVVFACTGPEPQQLPPDPHQAEERVREAQGVRGKLDITLAWNGHADLDLHVYCPEGHVSFNKPDACGGKLDIDRNASSPLVETPVEHVTWTEEPPPGHYRIEVAFFDRRDAPDEPVPFTVVLRDGNNERVFRGMVDRPEKTVVVTEFERN
jgi:hypothetical protein